MKGVVLCGGRSSRMGSDKGLLQHLDQTWAGLATAKLSSLEMDVVISVNKAQFDDYSIVFPADRLIVDDECISVKGPLLGLLTVHQNVPHEDLCVLACDMIGISEEILWRLVGALNNGIYDAYVYKTQASSQPLCAVYTSTALKNIYLRYRKNELKKFSLMHVLDCLNVQYITAERSLESSFNNYNSPDQLLNR